MHVCAHVHKRSEVYLSAETVRLAQCGPSDSQSHHALGRAQSDAAKVELLFCLYTCYAQTSVTGCMSVHG